MGDPDNAVGNACKCFLGGLSWETTEEHLKSYFGKYGEIEDVIVMKDRVTRQPRGFGFITFKDSSAAQRACSETHTIGGRTIDAKPSVPQGEGAKPPRSKKIFVGGLASETTEEGFKTYFEQFGRVTDAVVMVDHSSNRSRGFGFITYEDEEAVTRVFNIGNMHELDGKQVEVKSATPKGSGPLPPGRGGYGGGGGGYGAGGYGAGGGGYGAGGGGYGGGGYGGGGGFAQQRGGYGGGGSPAAAGMRGGAGGGYGGGGGGYGGGAAAAQNGAGGGYGRGGYSQDYSAQGAASAGAAATATAAPAAGAGYGVQYGYGPYGAYSGIMMGFPGGGGGGYGGGYAAGAGGGGYGAAPYAGAMGGSGGYGQMGQGQYGSGAQGGDKRYHPYQG